MILTATTKAGKSPIVVVHRFVPALGFIKPCASRMLLQHRLRQRQFAHAAFRQPNLVKPDGL